MAPLSYRRHRFPPEVIQHAIWLYLRFTLSYRDVEELLAERGLDLSYETIRRWVLKFGPAIARRLRQRRPRPGDRWHLDEMVVRIAGRHMYLWRAVDQEGEVLDMLIRPVVGDAVTCTGASFSCVAEQNLAKSSSVGFWKFTASIRLPSSIDSISARWVRILLLQKRR